jgi:nicotinamide-nucleotide adenylyltransferase
MAVFASDILSALPSSRDSCEPASRGLSPPKIDIAVTRHPYFLDKAESIISSSIYSPGTKLVFLTGFDTLIRILDAKYYPPTHTLEPCAALFDGGHKLRVTYRVGDSWGGKKEQEDYLEILKDGGREHEGGRREWAKQIKLVEGRNAEEEIVSSTKVREAAESGDEESLSKMVTDGVKEWILEERLYRD